MPDIQNITALGILALVIVLTDRWVLRFFKKFTESLGRVELSHQQQILLLLKCTEELAAIKESFRISGGSG